MTEVHQQPMPADRLTKLRRLADDAVTHPASTTTWTNVEQVGVDVLALLGEIDRLTGERNAVLALVEQAEYGARRWADPLPVPEWTGQVRAALDAVCCEWHRDRCCVPDDCGPCCPSCPTCPELVRARRDRRPLPALAFPVDGEAAGG